MDNNFQKEHKATAAFLKLMEDAEVCRLLHVEAGLRLPVRLAAMFQPDYRDDGNASSAAIAIPRPPPPSQPPRGATAGWIYLRIADAQETSLVLAVLARNKGTSASMTIQMVQALRPNVNTGTIANIGSRLEQEGIIRRDADGWWLVSTDHSFEFTREHIWGPPCAFQKQELATYRRMVILHILGLSADGQQVSQLTKILEKHCPWFSDDIPVTKFLVKADMAALSAKKLVKKISGSQKWALILSPHRAKATEDTAYQG